MQNWHPWSNSNNLIDFHFCNRISTFDQSPPFLLKFQHFDRFDILHSNFNILINSHLIALKRQLFDWFPTFHSKYNILNDLVINTQISTFWLIPNFVLKFQYSDRFLSFQTNSYILIDSHFGNKISTFDRYQIFTHISTFWSICHFALKFQHFDQFPPYCNQTSTFWLIPNFSLTIHHFERFGD